MSDSIRVLFLYGGDTKYHLCEKTNPIYKTILEKGGFQVTMTDDLDELRTFNIHKYDVIINGTTNAYISPEHEADLFNAIIGHPWNEGNPKGFIGIHGAAHTFRHSEHYKRMIGGRLLAHPYLNGPAVPFHVDKPDHPIMQGIEDFELSAELYLMEYYPPMDVLLSFEYKGFNRPVAWVKPYGFGRIFYVSLGHDTTEVAIPQMEKMLINAVKWTANTV